MEIGLQYQGQRFVWDAEKASSKAAKHGVTFEKASEIFFDPFVRIEDSGTSEEERDAAIGLTEDWELLFCCPSYTRRGCDPPCLGTDGDSAGTEEI